MHRPLLRRIVEIVLGLLFVFGAARTARAEVPHRTVDLYTIGAGSDFVSRMGHSVLCVREAGKDVPESGHCYDYGVPDREDIVHVMWTAVRNEPAFVPVIVDEPVVLKFFKDQGRQIERQRIPMTAEEADKLVGAIEQEVREKRAYAYHPYWANCTTKLRDHIDAATNGRLRAGPTSIPLKATLREYFEEGHSGHVDSLTAMAIYLGEGNDYVPTPWEAMLLPAILRDGVSDRFQTKPEQIQERLAVVLPTSRAIGKVFLFLVAFVLFVAVRIAARRRRMRVGLAIVGTVLGLLAISVDLVALLAKWPELSHNWALGLLLPTDLCLAWLSGKRLTIYLRVRVGLAALFAVLEIASIAHQPMLPLVALVALPMLGILSALKERAEAARDSAGTVKLAA